VCRSTRLSLGVICSASGTYSRHLAHVIRQVPPSALDVKCRIGSSELVTLRFLMEDYVVHLRHHLTQMSERI